MAVHHKEFEHAIETRVETKGKNPIPYVIVGRAQYVGTPKNKYLCQKLTGKEIVEIELDFCKCKWFDAGDIIEV
jgi:hypothetical protein